jgi:hypothetical protein
MRESPLRGFKAASEKKPRRAVASTDRYEAVRAVTDQVTMEVRWDGPRRRQRSYLTEILGWATARKQLPLADVAAAGGRKGTVALQRSYLHAGEHTMLTVVLSGAELRDVKKA